MLCMYETMGSILGTKKVKLLPTKSLKCKHLMYLELISGYGMYGAEHLE